MTPSGLQHFDFAETFICRTWLTTLGFVWIGTSSLLSLNGETNLLLLALRLVMLDQDFWVLCVEQVLV